MLYVATPSSGKVRDAMASGEIVCMTTPAQGNRIPDGATWAADNGCFGKGYPGDEKWLAWLASRPYDRAKCIFATAPDVVGDAAATLARSAPHLPTIRALGYPAALVAQDGLEDRDIPWDTFDVLFIGGSTEWKLSAAAAAITREAKRRGKWVHMGRVNSARRWGYAEHIGCDSVDGTFLVFGPDANLPRLRSWSSQGSLNFSEATA